MAIKPRKSTQAEGDNNIFWTTMSDLLWGLAIIFMTLFVLAMTGFTQQSLEQKKQQIETSKELIENLQEEERNLERDYEYKEVKSYENYLHTTEENTLSKPMVRKLILK